MANPHRAFDAGPLIAAAFFTRSSANSAQNPRQYIVFLIDQGRFIHATVGDVADILWNVRLCGAGCTARDIPSNRLEIARLIDYAAKRRQFQRIDRLFIIASKHLRCLAVRLQPQTHHILRQRFLIPAKWKEGIKDYRDRPDAIVFLPFTQELSKTVFLSAEINLIPFRRTRLFPNPQAAQTDIRDSIRRARVRAASDVDYHAVSDRIVFLCMDQILDLVKEAVRRTHRQRTMGCSYTSYDVAEPEKLLGLQAEGRNFVLCVLKALRRDTVKL